MNYATKSLVSPLKDLPQGDCLVCCDGKLVLELSQNILQSIQRLKRALQHCQSCPQNNTCVLLDLFHSQVRQATREILVDGALPFQAANKQ